MFQSENLRNNLDSLSG